MYIYFWGRKPYFGLNSVVTPLSSLRLLIPYSRPKLPDFHTLSQTKLLENHTLHSGTYLYRLYMGVPLPPPPDITLGVSSQIFYFPSKSVVYLSWWWCSQVLFFLPSSCLHSNYACYVDCWRRNKTLFTDQTGEKFPQRMKCEVSCIQMKLNPIIKFSLP